MRSSGLSSGAPASGSPASATPASSSPASPASSMPASSSPPSTREDGIFPHAANAEALPRAATFRKCRRVVFIAMPCPLEEAEETGNRGRLSNPAGEQLGSGQVAEGHDRLGRINADRSRKDRGIADVEPLHAVHFVVAVDDRGERIG